MKKDFKNPYVHFKKLKPGIAKFSAKTLNGFFRKFVNVLSNFKP